MIRRISLFVALGAVSLFGAVMIGCSSNAGSSVIPDTTEADAISLYFPVVEGYTTVYQIDHSDGSTETMTFEVGRQVPFKLGTAREWITTDNSGDRDISYLVADEHEVYYYATVRSLPERILSAPLTPGATWVRFGSAGEADTTAVTGTYDITLYDKFGGGGQLTDDGGTTGVVCQKTFPSAGGNEVLVDGIENLGLESGVTYSGSIRLKNDAGYGKSNYYWYAPGIGLTRYVLGASGDDYSTGEVVGELIDYGF